MKIIQLKYFQAVCKYNNISKAASLFNVSQPAISTSLKELEDEYGIKLFIRNNNRLQITEDGLVLLKHVDNFLKDYDELDALMRNHGKQKKLITIGVPPLIGTFLFPNLVNEFMSIYPDVQFSITETGSVKVLGLLDANQIDVGLISYNETKESNYNYIELLDTEFVYAVNKNHHLANEKEIDLSSLDNEQIILYSKDSYQNHFITEKIEEKGIKPIVFLHSSQLATILEFLKNPNIGAFLHKEIVDGQPDLVGIPFKEKIKVKVGLVYSKQARLTQTCQDFIDFCENKSKK